MPTLRIGARGAALRLLTVIPTLILAVAACSAPGGATPPSIPPTDTLSQEAPTPAPTLPPDSAPTNTPEPAATLTPGPPPPSTTTSFPNPENYRWAEVLTGLEAPVDLTNAGDGSGRLFIVEKPGRIRVAQGETLQPAPFLDITDRVGDNGSERGLLGLVFHPKYAENGYFYVNYTDGNGNTAISRFQVTGDPNVADPASEKKLLGVEQPFPNHNGGGLAFGPDGFLYIGLGDGGSGGDPHGNGQSTNTLLGKILRIDVDGGDPYTIPGDNPFASGGGKPEIWAYGLRNPWRLSFDSANGDFYTGDVGQNEWEEIDFLPVGSPGGANFGWDAMEGNHPFSGSDSLSFVAPVAEYSHSGGNGCSVTGGYVYRGTALPEWSGVYFYGDYCSGIVWGLLRSPDDLSRRSPDDLSGRSPDDLSGQSPDGLSGQSDLGWQSQQLFATGMSISTFGVDEAGELYLVWYGGKVYRLDKQ